MSEPDEITVGLRRQAAAGVPAVDIAKWLVGELGPKPTFFPFAAALFRAFNIPVQTLNVAARWSGLGFGGPMTDDELGEVLAPLIPRTSPAEAPDHSN